MKQYILLSLLFCAMAFAGCKRSTTHAVLKGEIKGMGTDTLFLYGNDEYADFILPVYVEDDKFSMTLPIDTLTQTMLYLNDSTEYPLFFDKSLNVNLKGDVQTPGLFTVKGGGENEALAAFYKELTTHEEPADTLVARLAAEYIYTHQKSYVSIYLLDRYFVRVESPNHGQIKELINIMDGSLQDRIYIEELQAALESSSKAFEGMTAPAFNLTTFEQQKVSRNDFKDNYLLVTFWASWCDSCDATNTELKAFAKTYPQKTKKRKEEERKKEAEKRKNESSTNKKPVTVVKKDPTLELLSISLDFDKALWLERIESDTLKWEHASDLSGWGSEVVRQYAIPSIPYQILIDPRGKIIARGLEADSLKRKIELLLSPKK